MEHESNPNPDREGFNEASLGEGQSENPPSDPEMLRGEDGEAEADSGGEGAESYGGDQDAGPAFDPDQATLDDDRDQAEG